ncbi:protein-disulfide reductase DsbD N-terminal domain-containing protein, partial [Salinibacter sp.]
MGGGGDATWSAEAAPRTLRAGEHFAARLRAEVEAGWYMYALDSPAGQPLSVSLDSLPAGIDTTGTLRQSDPTQKYDPNFEADAFFYEESAEVRAGLRVGKEVEPGTYVVGGSVRYMVCSDEMCMPPTTKPVSMTIEVESGAPRGAYAVVNYGDLVEPGPTASDNAQAAASSAGGVASGGAVGGRGGLWGFLLLA